MRDMDAPAASLEGFNDIGLERVSSHQRTARPGPVMRKRAAIGLGGFLRNDLDTVERVAKPGLGEYGILIQKGDESILCQAKELFVLPKGVAGVETFCCQ